MKLTPENAKIVSGTALIAGAVTILPGVLIMTERMAGPVVLGAVLFCAGLFGIIFGFTVNAARRMVAGLQNMSEGEER